MNLLYGLIVPVFVGYSNEAELNLWLKFMLEIDRNDPVNKEVE